MATRAGASPALDAILAGAADRDDLQDLRVARYRCRCLPRDHRRERSRRVEGHRTVVDRSLRRRVGDARARNSDGCIDPITVSTQIASGSSHRRQSRPTFARMAMPLPRLPGSPLGTMAVVPHLTDAVTIRRHAGARVIPYPRRWTS